MATTTPAPAGTPSPAPVTRASLAAALAEDERKLKVILYTYLDLPHPDTEKVAYDSHEIVQALTNQGITHFKRDFLSLSETDIRELDVPGASPKDPRTPLSLINKRRLILILAFYHYTCSEAKGEVKLESVPRAAFDDFRIHYYDPNEPIRPWKTVIAKAAMTTGPTPESELSIWKKSVRPNKADYKEFRDESLWVRSKEQFTTTLESHSLSHLTDETHVPTDLDLDAAQRGWLYSVLQTVFKAPMAKTIVTRHLATKDTRLIWKEICEYYDSSMTSVLRSQMISSYLTSTRLHSIQWRGTQANFILHWMEQARIHNEISDTAFTENQLVTFLNACLSGTANLSQVLTLHRTAQKAAGISTPIKISEYVALLLDQAQVHDAGNTHNSNPRARRSVNSHEFLFEDNDFSSDTHTYEIYNTEVHDHETPIELLVNRTEQGGPRRPRVDFDTWKSLSKEDQVAWDTVSDKGKTTIMTYVAKNASKFTGILRNGNQKTRFANDVTKPRQVNSHEQSHDSNTNDDTDPNPTGTTTIQVSTHQLAPKTTVQSGIANNDFDDILTMATTKTTSESRPDALLTINKIMSTPTIEGKVHETHYERPDYGLEAFVHKVKIGNYEYEVESEDEGNDFSYEAAIVDTTYEKFDYSTYRERPDPEPSSIQPIDQLEEVSFLLERTDLEDDPEEEEPTPLPPLDTVQDLLSFHADPEANKSIPERHESRTLSQADFELTDDIDNATGPNQGTIDYSTLVGSPNKFDYSQFLVEADAALHGIEESKEESSPDEMMKPPFDHVKKPTPTKTRIVPNEENSKFVFTKNDSECEIPPLEAIPPPSQEQESPHPGVFTSIVEPPENAGFFDYTKYLDDPMVPPPHEATFSEKPVIQTNMEENTNEEWTVATRRKPKRKQTPTSNICSFLSPKSYAEAAISSSSSGSSPSSKSDQQDFQQAGSD